LVLLDSFALKTVSTGGLGSCSRAASIENKKVSFTGFAGLSGRFDLGVH
jgi:hypothetical protein